MGRYFLVADILGHAIEGSARTELGAVNHLGDVIDRNNFRL